MFRSIETIACLHVRMALRAKPLSMVGDTSLPGSMMAVLSRLPPVGRPGLKIASVSAADRSPSPSSRKASMSASVWKAGNASVPSFDARLALAPGTGLNAMKFAAGWWTSS